MADPVQATAQTGQTQGLQVPPEVEAAFGPIIAMIKTSESMNPEERQYWVNILPIMTPEQLQNLKDILENERKQLASIDAKYQGQSPAVSPETLQKAGDERRKRRQELQSKEAAHRQEEGAAAEALLEQAFDTKPDASTKK